MTTTTRTAPPTTLLGDVTIPDLLHSAVRRRGDHTYLRSGEQAFSLTDLDQAVDRLRRHLVGLGVRRGDRVAVMLPNRAEHVALIFALISLRSIWVPVNPKLRGEPLVHQLRSSDPRLVIVDPQFAEQHDMVHDVGLQVPVLRWNASPDEPPPKCRLAPSVETGQPLPLQADDVVALMFTSGTSGPAKGVGVTDRMLRASAVGAHLTAGTASGDVYFLWEPLCHIGGAQVLLLPLLGRVTIAMAKRFSASRFWAQTAATGATHIHHLGGIIPMLLSRPATPADRSHRVRVSWGGGMTPEVWQEAESRFGISVAECYGMTEASSISTVNTTGAAHGIGTALPHFDVQVIDQEGKPLEEGSTGQIVIRPQHRGLITPGYFRNPTATAQAWYGGWWHTGDSGRWLDGSLHYTGRLSDSVRHAGENVSAWEVESVINSHPDVSESALVGIPNRAGEHDLAIYVRPAETCTIQPQALIDWCHNKLARYQVPRYVAVIDELPKTPSQRVMKAALPRNPDGWFDQATTGQ